MSVTATGKICGAHFHMDVEKSDLPKASAIQKAFLHYLETEDIRPSHTDVFKLEKGSHILHRCQIRLGQIRLEKNPEENILEKVGFAALWLALNRNGLQAHVDPLTDDNNTIDPAEDHKRSLWMGASPVLDAESESVQELPFVNPREVLVNGFHVHVDFEPHERAMAFRVFKAFNQYLKANSIVPTDAQIHNDENGPHILPGWEVTFETANPDVVKTLGKAIGYLMLNREDLAVLIHPVTWKEGDAAAMIKAHSAYAMHIGEKKAPLNLSFFTNMQRKIRQLPLRSCQSTYMQAERRK
ncbi:MAG TPA: DOPA 4,5-dioxygenase family protein [Chlamydiales bacterium]|nr:DOPA 4,5-dioxygenase family protein [Chlamydiales bacterium]